MTTNYDLNGDSLRRIKFAREAAAVDRCHTAYVLGSYNNGQHSFNMLTMLRVLCPKASTALIWAIVCHDLPERLTGDIPAPAKWFSEQLASELEILEKHIRVATGFDYGPLSDKEQKWLKGLDLLELYMWTLDQVALGNNNVIKMSERIERWFKEHKANVPQPILGVFFKCNIATWEFMPDLGDEMG